MRSSGASIPAAAVVDRIWAQVGRATGTIVERKGPATLLVDEGPASGRKVVIIARETAGRIQVRFPRLEPGYLIDVIGLKQDGFLPGADSRHLAAAVPGRRTRPRRLWSAGMYPIR